MSDEEWMDAFNADTPRKGPRLKPRTGGKPTVKSNDGQMTVKKRESRTKKRPQEIPGEDLTRGKPKVIETKRKPPKPKEKPPEEPRTLKGVEAREHRDQYEDMRRWFDQARFDSCPIYIGIDTGKEGAFGMFQSSQPDMATAFDIPVMVLDRAGKTKKGNKRTKTLYDEAIIWRYVQLWLPLRGQIFVGLEETHPRETDRGLVGFGVGYGFGMWPLFLRSHGFAFDTVMPGVWKKSMTLAGKDKEWSRLMAQRLWPNAPLFRKGDDGRAEALLIAEYFRRKRTNVK